MNEKDIYLKVTNFKGIKKADIKINGLSIIGGKNAEGKSTIGKLIMALLKTDNRTRMKEGADKKQCFENYFFQLFDETIQEEEGVAEVYKGGKKHISVLVKNGKCESFEPPREKERVFLDCTLIQTPVVWDLQDFFSDITKAQQDFDSDLYLNGIRYPYAIFDLYLKLTRNRLRKKLSISLQKSLGRISKIIGGTFVKNSEEKYHFYHSQSGKNISLLSTASGIKVFGIVLNLLNNSYFTPRGFFVFDEPENHLHPTWQVKFAEVIVQLVGEGISVMVNTHSPYLLEAFQKLMDKEKAIPINFYLAQDGVIEQIGNSNYHTLEKTFELLNESYEQLDNINLERIENGRSRNS